MAIQSLELASAEALADMAARRLAASAMTNVELSEALVTTERPNGVRIGKYDITYRTLDNNRIFDISRNGKSLYSDIAFYETAHYMVKLLNRGRTQDVDLVNRLEITNEEYFRARSNARLHADRTRYYERVGDNFRADLNENKFSRDAAKVVTLRQRLLLGSPQHY